MIAASLTGLVAIGAMIAAYYAICAIAAMDHETNEPIRWGFIAKAVGYFVQVIAAFDYFQDVAIAWPWLLLIGVALANFGTGLIFVTNRRDCTCPVCPARKGCHGSFLVGKVVIQERRKNKRGPNSDLSSPA